MLDYATYQLLARRLEDRHCSVASVFDEARRLPDEQSRRMRLEIRRTSETDVRIFFYRVLYRFHLKWPELRDEYLRLIGRSGPAWRQTARANIIRCADLIDVGDYGAAFKGLRAMLWRSNRRWRISALFQILRIGVLSEAHRRRCLPLVLSLRTLLEAEFSKGRHEDRITKYALCSLFITQCHLQTFRDDTDSVPIREAVERLERSIEALLTDERTWDAC